MNMTMINMTMMNMTMINVTMMNMTMMNISSSNEPLCELGPCWKEAAILVVFRIWGILDTLLVLFTNGGTIAIIYMHRYDMLDIPSNIFIGCLTLGDLVSVLALPFGIASSSLSHTWGWTVSCFVTLWVAMTSAFINMVTLAVIAVDRLIYIVYPLQYHTRMPVTRAFKICRVIWVACCLYSLLVISFGYTDAYHVGIINRPCHSSFSIEGFPQQLLFYPFIICLPITIGSYIKVGVVAIQQRNLMAAEGNMPVPASGGLDFRITKVMFNVISVYLLCTLIIIVTPVILKYANLGRGDHVIVFRVQLFVWRMNAWLNPVIYAGKSEKFRKYVRAIFNRNSEHNTDISVIM